ncbi:A disintegrin and metallo ase with thrombospondin motifs 18 isoform X2, partial [Brachionus plicatilis]
MYLDLKFAQIILLIDYIYQNINSSLLEIKIEFVNLFINFKNEFDFSTLINNSSLFLDELSKRTILKEPEKYKLCDHLFFVHSFKHGGTLGFTRKGRICSGSRVSAINYGTSHFLEAVMAHELAHNLGIDHDDVIVVFPNGTKMTCDDENLMSKRTGFRSSYYRFSDCSIQSLANNLLTPENKTLLDFYRCLSDNNPTKWIQNYKEESRKKMPGHFFSMSDQCRYFLNFSKSYYCRSNIVNCGTLFCYNRDRKCQKVAAVLFDGTVCGANLSCVKGYCIRNQEISHLVWKWDPKKVNNKLENAIVNLKNTCPGGASLEKIAFNNKEKDLEKLYTKPCSEILFGNYELLENSSLVQMKLYFRTICCEVYLKSSKQICGGPKYECILPPCERFKTNPCFNNGKCVNYKSNLHPSNLSFECVCPKGFRGLLCLDVDPCALNPCNEGELCVTF